MARAKHLTAFATLVAMCVVPFTMRAWGASGEKVLHTFAQQDGAYPSAGLVFDAAGNLYGTTTAGGSSELFGTIFKLSPGANGAWTLQVLHTFEGPDGQTPYANLIFDKAGNLYGTTQAGGNGTSNGGTVFELSPGSNGQWTETVLHSFSGSDGYFPSGGLIFDSAGNLYGTTMEGGHISDCSGSFGCGTVFKLAPGSNGQWALETLHAFTGKDECAPTDSLVFDAAGNLYGTTYGGGDCGYPAGTVFELQPGTNGQWTEILIHRFNFADGSNPAAGLIFDASGNLYGTTYGGGNAGGAGTVFKLSPSGTGQWTHTILHSFNTSDGYGPVAPLIFDRSGNLYSTTYQSGPRGWGTVFKLTPGSNGTWVETILHAFAGSDGRTPSGGVISDSAGNLYGTAAYGGNLNDCAGTGCGTIFKIIP